MTAKSMHMISKTFQVLLLSSIASSLLAQVLEAPPIVIRSNTQTGTVWAQERVGAPAEDSTVQVQSPVGGLEQGASVNATGSNLSINSNSVAQPSSMVVAGDPPCAAGPKSWTIGGATCTASFPSAFSGASASGTDSVQPVVGSASFSCSMGTWAATPSAGATCVA